MKITGRVVAGDRLGRTLGYPTANIDIEDALPAKNGVYAATVTLDGRRYGAMANLGVKPTFADGGDRRILEVHLLGFEGDLYGRELTVEMVSFVRSEQRFTGAEALKAQIEKDEKQIKKLLKCT